MRKNSAVSEIIGAVILIAVVIGGMSMVAVLMLSTPPPEKLPKLSISAYCVECGGSGNYEIIMYHGGGEVLIRDYVRFFILTNSDLILETEPYFVYHDVPEYCGSSFGDSNRFGKEEWKSSKEWVSGQTLRFFYSSPDGNKPKGIQVRYYPYHSNIASAEFSSTRYGAEGWVPDTDVPDGVKDKENLPPYHVGLIPILVKNECPVSGNPAATFTYISPSDYSIPSHKDYLPWNEFVGSDNSYGNVPTTTFTRELSNTDSSLIKITYDKSIQWKLGSTVSEVAECP